MARCFSFSRHRRRYTFHLARLHGTDAGPPGGADAVHAFYLARGAVGMEDVTSVIVENMFSWNLYVWKIIWSITRCWLADIVRHYPKCLCAPFVVQQTTSCNFLNVYNRSRSVSMPTTGLKPGRCRLVDRVWPEYANSTSSKIQT